MKWNSFILVKHANSLKIILDYFLKQTEMKDGCDFKIDSVCLQQEWTYYFILKKNEK